MMGGVTTFHVGVVFLFMGLLLLISGLMPGYANNKRPFWEERSSSKSNDNTAPSGGSPNSTSTPASSSPKSDNNRRAPLLLGTGSFLILMGVMLIVAHRIASRKEEERFSRYITRKLAPAKIVHLPVSSSLALQQIHKRGNNKEEAITVEKDGSEEEMTSVMENSNRSDTLGGAAHCQSPSHLESIIEETEGLEKTSGKDQLNWTSDVAPVHHHQHYYQQSQKEQEPPRYSGKHHNHVHDSSTG